MAIIKCLHYSLLLYLSLIIAQPASANYIFVNVPEENFRASPNGKKIGTMLHGTRLEEIERKGNWVRVKAEGWIWLPSLTTTQPKALKLNKRSLDIVSYRWVNQTFLKHIRIEGVVQNYSSKILRSVHLFITATDSNGNFLGNADTYAEPDTIPPGETSTFTAYVDDAICATNSMNISFRFSAR